MNRGAIEKWLWMTLLAAAIGGCATTRVDWPARIGHYTYDQAVLDYGPPDKYARLSDGTIVADWMLRAGYMDAWPEPFPTPDLFPPPVFYNQTYVPGCYMQLAFAPNGLLESHKTFSR
ncbi:MAG: hypothetical protein KGR98_05720 [Verrucomicrobia bacterium]|nr:hypothetical protein [Verrucomicrobiota bacterium]MDE3098803.1 hypothetical protein [Verrucomicrobiota bacterium]